MSKTINHRIHNSRTFQLDSDLHPNTDQTEKTGAGEVSSGANRPLVIFSAGGKGTRIQSLNSTVPKPMIPIAGKPILQWGIENLVSQGYKHFIITVSHLASVITDYFSDGSVFGDGSKHDCTIEYYHETEPLGNAGALFKMMESGQIKQGSSFLYFIADAIFDIDADRFWNYHTSCRSLASLFVHPNSHPYDSGLVVTGDSKRVVQWLNKEDDRPQWYKNQVNAGLQILSTELLQMSNIDPTTVDAEHHVDLDRDILKPLLGTKRIYAYHSSEYCKDAGTLERFHAVEEDIKSGRVFSRNLKNHQKAIFLDRDGTINRYNGFVRSIPDFELLPGVAEAIKFINQSGYLAIVVTNQPVIARGEVTTAQLDQIHCKLETLLGSAGAYLDAIYFCPHHPDKGFAGEIPELKGPCDCRKPKPGLLIRASQDYNIDLERSWMIGDSWRDIECGQNAGCRTILLNGDGTEGSETEGGESSHPRSPDYTASDLLSAVKMII